MTDPDWYKNTPAVVEREEAPPEAAPADDFEVRIRQLEIHPHPNADALELAQVDGYRAVVRKGEFQTGDYALYIPEKALLPQSLLEEIGLLGKLSGSGKNRVKPMRLRGVLSEGIVCRPQGMTNAWTALEAKQEFGLAAAESPLLGVNWAEHLGIEKWTVKVPAHLRGQIKPRGSSTILPFISIPNIKKAPWMFSPGEIVIATEKIHGTCFLATLELATGEFMVSSKGMGKQGWDLVEDPSNLYWQAARKWLVEEWMREASQFFRMFNPARIAVYGEVYGVGVQDLGYSESVGLRLFDVRVDDAWMSQYIVQALCSFLSQAEWGFQIQAVPVLYDGPYDYDKIAEIAEGPSTLPGARNIREGVVVRSPHERIDGSGARVIAKFISEAYLTRKGAQTEFE